MSPTDMDSNSIQPDQTPPVPSQPSQTYPAKIGRYQILGELGRGAMGRVYRAFDPNVGRNVALKVIPIESGDPEMIARFRREAQAAGILSHPNIVTIYDAGSDEGFLYIAMELVEGETLQKLLARGPLPVEQAIVFGEQTGAALDHAHGRAIIHRDIKPANIMVQQGQVKVTDFGVAKVGSAGMTSTGQILGTPSYLAPEVVKGGAADARSDLFSLGVVLYEMLTGAKPFAGDTLSTVIYRIISEPPLPPASVVTSLPAGFNYVVLKALAKNPDERYGTCAELTADLKNHAALEIQGRRAAEAATASAGSPDILTKTAKLNVGIGSPLQQPASAAVSSSRKMALWAAAGTVAILIAAGLWRQNRNASAPATPAPAAASQPAGVGASTSPSPPAAGNTPGSAASGTAVSTPKPSAFGDPIPDPSAAESSAPPVSGERGRVIIHTLPPGAAIRVNDDATSYRSPVNFALAPGHYEITIERDGFSTVKKEIDVEANRVVTMEIELKRGGIIRRLNPFRR